MDFRLNIAPRTRQLEAMTEPVETMTKHSHEENAMIKWKKKLSKQYFECYEKYE